MTNKETFLTLEEAKKQAYPCYEYKKGVYYYAIDVRYTLIEDGKILVSDVGRIRRYQKGVYAYEKDGNWSLIEDGKILVEDVDCVFWHEKGFYEYKKDGKWNFNIITTKI